MREFLHFAESYGLIIRDLQQDRWARVPTMDHPKKRNGAYKFFGTFGFVQNHGTMPDVATWKQDQALPLGRIDVAVMHFRAEKAAEELRNSQAHAAAKARHILSVAAQTTHQYLTTKGFPAERGNVIMKGDKPILLIPMRIENEVVGLQMINAEGSKRFLAGQRTGGAEYIIGNPKLRTFLCEGYATGLSIHAALASSLPSHCVRICFSAGNMAKIAKTLNADTHIMVADNDKSGTGQRVARESGMRYWLSDVEGEDFNDFHQRVGTFNAGQSLKLIVK